MALTALIALPLLVKWFSRDTGPDLFVAWLASALIVQPVLLWVLSDHLRHKQETYGRRVRVVVIPTLFLGCAAAVPAFSLVWLPNGIGILLGAAAATGLSQVPYVWRRLAPRTHDGE